MTYPPTGLNNVMDELVVVEGTVHPDLRVYRWRPNGFPEVPALYNWIGSTLVDRKSTTRQYDAVTILARIAIRHGDSDEDGVKLETYADAFAAVIDKALYRNQPLNGAATYAERTGMRTVLDAFNDTDALCIEFPLVIRVRRELPANQP